MHRTSSCKDLLFAFLAVIATSLPHPQALALSSVATCPACIDPLAPKPQNLGLDSFYQKHLDVRGFPIVSSHRVPDSALREAARIVRLMTAPRPEILREMARQKVRLAVMAKDEVTIDIPEHRDLYQAFPKTDWNRRARGLGATSARPAVSVGEENLLHYPQDRYRGESILIHEFSHAMDIMGLRHLDKTFAARLKETYDSAMSKGLWKNTYAATNKEEYWAEGVQSWFNANLTASPPNGIHNEIDTREELKQYDPDLARLIESVYGPSQWQWKQTPESPRACPTHALSPWWPD